MFLETMGAIEGGPMVTLFDVLKERGLDLPSPDNLDDDQLTKTLWNLIWNMAVVGSYLHFTDHLSDRELYTRLWNDILREPTPILPEHSHYTEHIDLSSGDSDEDLMLYLKYYADESERASWASRWPDLAIPEPAPLPYDRDRDLPQPVYGKRPDAG